MPPQWTSIHSPHSLFSFFLLVEKKRRLLCNQFEAVAILHQVFHSFLSFFLFCLPCFSSIAQQQLFACTAAPPFFFRFSLFFTSLDSKT